MGLKMYLPISVQCDNCPEEMNLSYELDIKKATRYKQVFTNRWLRTVYSGLVEEARLQGWMIETNHCYCPHCADALEDGSVNPRVRELDSKALINELKFRRKLKQMKDDYHDN